jgi:hypothetical protein
MVLRAATNAIVRPPAVGSQRATYNTRSQLTNLPDQALTWNANGYLTSDGQRTFRTRLKFRGSI